MKFTKQHYKKIAFALSLAVLILWSVLGTGASLAWFTDTSNELRNNFNTAEFELEVLYRDETGTYTTIEGSTEIFNDQALFEPGYTQVVYLKATNQGDIPFQYQTAVIINGFIPGTNVYGEPLILQEYLRFGLVSASTEEALEELVATREQAIALATEPLNDYYSTVSSMDPQETTYIALVVHMPTYVANEANYRGMPIPEVHLGISVTATQQQ